MLAIQFFNCYIFENARISRSILLAITVLVNMVNQMLYTRRPTAFVLLLSLVIISLLFLFRETILPVPANQKTSSISNLSKPTKDGIPRNIWQIYFGDIPSGGLDQALWTWISKNSDHSHVLMRNEGADDFVRKHYSSRPDLMDVFLELEVPVLRSDLLRYMILESEGGIYSDLDTTAEKPIAEWIPEEFKSQVSVMVGIEYDQLDAEKLWPGLSLKIQFCQWTLASRKGHPLMTAVVKKVASSIQELAQAKNISIVKLDPTDHEVTQTTGPVIWTTTVFEGLSAAAGKDITFHDITNMTAPRLFGDILVLPINGFGTGQEHSNSDLYGAKDALVRHQFKGSWKHNWP